MNEFLSRARRLFVTTIAVGLCAFGPTAVRAKDLKVRIGHFPNVTHAHALVARNFERQGQNWFADRLGPNIKVE